MKQVKAILLVALFIGCLAGLKWVYDSMTAKNKFPATPGDLKEKETQAILTQAQTEPITLPTTIASTTAASSVATSQAKRDTVPLPDFTLTDSTGEEVEIASFKGKKTIMNFWASWCGPCQYEMPEFMKMDQAAEQGDYQVIMVNVTGGMETKERAEAFLKKEKLSFSKLFFDTTGDAAMELSITGLPTTIFMDEDGEVHFYHQGQLTKEDLELGLSKME